MYLLQSCNTRLFDTYWSSSGEYHAHPERHSFHHGPKRQEKIAPDQKSQHDCKDATMGWVNNEKIDTPQPAGRTRVYPAPKPFCSARLGRCRSRTGNLGVSLEKPRAANARSLARRRGNCRGGREGEMKTNTHTKREGNQHTVFHMCALTKASKQRPTHIHKHMNTKFMTRTVVSQAKMTTLAPSSSRTFMEIERQTNTQQQSHKLEGGNGHL